MTDEGTSSKPTRRVGEIDGEDHAGNSEWELRWSRPHQSGGAISRKSRQIRDRPDRARLRRPHFRNRRDLRAGHRPRHHRAVADRSAQYHHRRSRPRTAQCAGSGRGDCRRRDPEAQQRRQRQPPAALRRGQPRQSAGNHLFQRCPVGQRLLQGSRRRQRLPDEPRLHRGDQRLAGRSRPARQLADHLAAGGAGHHRHFA